MGEARIKVREVRRKSKYQKVRAKASNLRNNLKEPWQIIRIWLKDWKESRVRYT